MRRWDRLLDSYIEQYAARGVSKESVAMNRARIERWGRWLKARRPRVEGKTRNGNLRTLSRHRQLTGAGPQRPKLVRIQRFFRLPGVIARQIDVLPAER